MKTDNKVTMVIIAVHYGRKKWTVFLISNIKKDLNAVDLLIHIKVGFSISHWKILLLTLEVFYFTLPW